ncbi:RICIN domain-containing protein [Lentzea sp. NPDC054927]
MATALVSESVSASAVPEKVTHVSSLTQYLDAAAEGKAANVVTLEYGALVGRGPNGEESRVLDVENWQTANRSRLQMWDYLTAPDPSNQRWYIYHDDRWATNVVAIWGDQSGRCLDESRDHQAADGTAVYIYDCSYASNQLWKLVPHPAHNGYLEIRNVYDDRCLDIRDYQYVNGATIQVWRCLSYWNQAWA